MKLKLLATILTFSISIASYSQVPYKADYVNLLIKAGVNMSNIISDQSKATTGIGFTGGFAAEFFLTDGIYLQTGLNVSTRNIKYEYVVEGESNSTTYKYESNPIYLQVPIHLGSKMKVNRMLSLTVDIGPYIAYGIAGKEKQTMPLPEVKTEYFSKNRKPIDLGFGIEAGFETGIIAFDIGVDLGLVKINKTAPKDVRNLNAYATIGYIF